MWPPTAWRPNGHPGHAYGQPAAQRKGRQNTTLAVLKPFDRRGRRKDVATKDSDRRRQAKHALDSDTVSESDDCQHSSAATACDCERGLDEHEIAYSSYSSARQEREWTDDARS